MEKFAIQGGVVLNGTIRISGAKNAALPILMSTLLLGLVFTRNGNERFVGDDLGLKLVFGIGDGLFACVEVVGEHFVDALDVRERG